MRWDLYFYRKISLLGFYFLNTFDDLLLEKSSLMIGERILPVEECGGVAEADVEVRVPREARPPVAEPAVVSVPASLLLELVDPALGKVRVQKPKQAFFCGLGV